MTRLPPLNAIRVFQAAGKLQNFSDAAEVLGVTPGAVSRQIKLLEDHLGVSLFVRVGKTVKLTRLGEIYLRSCSDGMARLENGTREILTETGNQPLHIWGSRFFIRFWLLPRLPGFQELYPDQDITITTILSSEAMPPEIDAAFRYGDGYWSGMKSDFLLGRDLTPVCSPEYLARHTPLRNPSDLGGHVLLQGLLGTDDWNQWYAKTGSPPAKLRQRITFTSADVAYDAAREGSGIVLGRRGFCDEDIASGRLVAPFAATTLHAEGAFYLAYFDRDPLPARLIRFRRWLLRELESQRSAAKERDYPIERIHELPG